MDLKVNNSGILRFDICKATYFKKYSDCFLFKER
jgi:hypothetical protein